MSRTLISLLFTLAVVAGCAVQPPDQTAGDQPADKVMYATVEEWLDLQQEVGELDAAEVAGRLAMVGKSASTDQLYYYGVLNQQLKTYGAWTVARDSFQKLQGDPALPKEHRQLAGILRQYNQNRINSYAKQRDLRNERAKLQQNLSDSEGEKQQLAKKIQALTQLEAAISTRREE